MEIPGTCTPPQSTTRSPSRERQPNLDPSVNIMVQITRAAEIPAHHVGVNIDEADDVSPVESAHNISIGGVDLEEEHAVPAPVQQAQVPAPQAAAPAPQGIVQRLLCLGQPSVLRYRVGIAMFGGGVVEMALGGMAGLMTSGPGLVTGSIVLPGAVVGTIGLYLWAPELLLHPDPDDPPAPPPPAIEP
jgi:hypothetical protein